MVYQSWMLPEGVCESLIDDTKKIDWLEQLANQVFASWGYQRLRPPMMEYLDVLASGSSDILFDQTIQFKDQLSGKQLAIRADITPQITRIDQHYLKTDKVARYAYSGEVLRAYPSGHGYLRNPTVVGLELFGSKSWQADAEVMMVLLSFLAQANVANFVLDIGNIDVATGLLESLDVKPTYFADFFEALRIKDREGLLVLCQQNDLTKVGSEAVMSLLDLNGDVALLNRAKTVFKDFSNVLQSVEVIENVVKLLQDFSPQTSINIDLGEVDGYAYHNGLTFAVYQSGVWQPIARGGRYDYAYNNEVDRGATGLSCNLNILSKLVNLPKIDKMVISYDLPNTAKLMKFIDELREKHVVIQTFVDVLSVREITHQIKTNKDGDYYLEVN